MEYSDIVISFFIGCLSAITVGYFIPATKRRLYSIFNRLYFQFSPYAINLSGKWEAHFTETEVDGNILDSLELITMQQTGSYLEGIGKIEDKYARKFRYTGQIIHDFVNGTYHRLDEPRGSIVGVGFFQLKISQDRNTLKGKCMWLDKDTEKIETSDYKWTRK